MSPKDPTTSLCAATADDVIVRGRSLPREIIGKMSFTALFYLHVTGRAPTPGQVDALDGCLVTLMEHGLTPSAIAARLTIGSAPEALQGAVAAGLLGVGSVFAGSSEACGALLARIAAATDPDAEAAVLAAEARARRERLPGFGHPVHRPVDPRAVALLDLAHDRGVAGPHVAALAALAAAVVAAAARAIPVNATGAIAAILLDIGIPASILRGVAIVSRAAGIVGHLAEEASEPAFTALWHGAEAAVPYAVAAPESSTKEEP